MALDPHPQLSLSKHKSHKDAPQRVSHLLDGDHHHMCHIDQQTPGETTRKTSKTQSLAALARQKNKRAYFEDAFSLRPAQDQVHNTTIITAELKTNVTVHNPPPTPIIQSTTNPTNRPTGPDPQLNPPPHLPHLRPLNPLPPPHHPCRRHTPPRHQPLPQRLARPGLRALGVGAAVPAAARDQQAECGAAAAGYGAGDWGWGCEGGGEVCGCAGGACCVGGWWWWWWLWEGDECHGPTG